MGHAHYKLDIIILTNIFDSLLRGDEYDAVDMKFDVLVVLNVKLS